MKVLWFTNTSSLYDLSKQYYNGCGWIESLEVLMHQQKSIQLGICFFHYTDEGKYQKGNTTYYPIRRKPGTKAPLRALLNNWQGQVDVVKTKYRLLKVVQDFIPDIIHVFGTEEIFASINELTKIPIVIHLQGLINPYYSTYFGVNQSKWDYIFDLNYLKNNIIGTSPAFTAFKMKNQAKREEIYLKNTKYVMGRTKWDERVSKIYNPSIIYFHVDEVLRPEFYIYEQLQPNKATKTLKIISTLSENVYKGVDVILKVANLLKTQTKAEFIWTIVGIESNCLLVKHFEKSLGLTCRNINVKFVGRKDSSQLKLILQESDVFIHPSYIDNSPNSVCEAQMVGIPVIACAVGGLNSIVEHDKTGILVPSNGVFEIVHYIKKYIEQPNIFKSIGASAQIVSNQRHNKKKILDSLLNVYSEIIN